MFNGAVKATEEFHRVLNLPRRVPEISEHLIDELTEALKTPQGTQRFRPSQALALYEMLVHGSGAFCPLGVGQGKTLISFLGAYVLDAKKPVLCGPAGLLRKTVRDLKELREHWLIPDNVQLMSYELLARENYSNWLEETRPDLLILDESHKGKNKRAAVTRRIGRYLKKYPATRVIALTGTCMRKSLLEFGHILFWCLRERAPVPRVLEELEMWASALDTKTLEFERVEPGALLQLCPGEDSLEAVRRGFQRRLVETPGVIPTIGEGEQINAEIHIRAIKYDVKPDTDEFFKKLRKKMLTPDDWQLMQAVDVWRHARELALGLYYRWDPRPPPAWREARKNWGCFVREVLSRSRTLDTELQVANACDAGKLDASKLNEWRRLRDREPVFKPNTVAVWEDDSALKVCTKWMQKPGVVWTEHALFAEKLSTLTGCKYYGAKGLASDGSFVDDADPSKAAILSLDANREGRNLQKIWSRCLFTALPEGVDVLEQAIGRFHRPGATAKVVEVDILLGCEEHANAWRRAVKAAEAVRDTTGTVSKILLATKVQWPSDDEIDNYVGARWGV